MKKRVSIVTCSECTGIWFEWQNRAVEREMEKWIAYNKDLVNNINH